MIGFIANNAIDTCLNQQPVRSILCRYLADRKSLNLEDDGTRKVVFSWINQGSKCNRYCDKSVFRIVAGALLHYKNYDLAKNFIEGPAAKYLKIDQWSPTKFRCTDGSQPILRVGTRLDHDYRLAALNVKNSLWYGTYFSRNSSWNYNIGAWQESYNSTINNSPILTGHADHKGAWSFMLKRGNVKLKCIKLD